MHSWHQYYCVASWLPCKTSQLAKLLSTGLLFHSLSKAKAECHLGWYSRAINFHLEVFSPLQNFTKVKLSLKVIARKYRPCSQGTAYALSSEPLLAALQRNRAEEVPEEGTIASTLFWTTGARKQPMLSCNSSKFPRILRAEKDIIKGSTFTIAAS